jgi:hypothetical protein
MILGRPKNIRKRIIATIMNEKEEKAFLEYFKEWKTNREVTGVLFPNSVKPIDTNVGNYCNKFSSRKWLNKDKKDLEYSYKTKYNKKATKSQEVPAYKGNIAPFIEYFISFPDNILIYNKIDFIFAKKVIPTLYLFFELSEVRENFTMFYQTILQKPLRGYNAFEIILERDLIYNWLYFEGRFQLKSNENLKLDPLILWEYLLINHNKLFNKVQGLIKKYYLDKRDDYHKLEIREKIVEEFNLSWKEFKKEGVFEKIRKINMAQNPEYTKKLLDNLIKIKYFAGLLHDEKISSAISKVFLGYAANSLINLQRPPITLKFKERLTNLRKSKQINSPTSS